MHRIRLPCISSASDHHACYGHVTAGARSLPNVGIERPVHAQQGLLEFRNC